MRRALRGFARLLVQCQEQNGFFVLFFLSYELCWRRKLPIVGSIGRFFWFPPFPQGQRYAFGLRTSFSKWNARLPVVVLSDRYLLASGTCYDELRSSMQSTNCLMRSKTARKSPEGYQLDEAAPRSLGTPQAGISAPGIPASMAAATATDALCHGVLVVSLVDFLLCR
jgi:hypothetical protein